MEKFFRPKSIAVVGASTRGGGLNIINNLLYGYPGKILPVNTRYKEIEGLPCYSTLEDISQQVDLAIILVPAPVVPGVIEACVRKGIPRVMIESAGFAEIGEQGKILQDRCVATARKGNIRIWGPNCFGLVDIPNKHFFSFMNPAVYEEGLIPGRVSLVSQSGMMSAAFLTECMSHGKMGIGKACSIGNKADLDECDLLEYLLADTETDAVALYLESINRGRLFTEIAAKSSKPIVLLKSGRSEAGGRAAMSHTASLSGNSRLAESVLQIAGVTLAYDFNHLMELAATLAMTPKLSPRCRTAILTFSGGAGVVACDLLEKYGLPVAKFSQETRKGLKEILPEWMQVGNPVDLFAAIELHGRLPTYNQATQIVLDDPNVDAILILYIAGREAQFMDLETIRKKADSKRKVVMFYFIGREDAAGNIQRDAQAFGFPAHRGLSRAVECLAAAASFQGRKAATVKSAYEILPKKDEDRLELNSFSDSQLIWDEYEAKQLLSKWNIPVVEEKIVQSFSEAKQFALHVGYPVVLKGLLPGEIHKTEKGMVHLGITTKEQLADAYRKMKKSLDSKGRILVQRQVQADYELIVGFLRDLQFGPCVMFGVGGIFSELEKDIIFAPAPLNQALALETLRRIRGKRILQGFRGMPPVEQEHMAQIIVNLGNLGIAYPRIEQIDLNPVIVNRGIPSVVDASIILKPLANSSEGNDGRHELARRL